MVNRFINGQWMNEREFRQWRIEQGYNQYIDMSDALRRLPLFSQKALDNAIRQLQTTVTHPNFNGPDADSQEQLRQHILLSLLHVERGYRLALSAFKQEAQE